MRGKVREIARKRQRFGHLRITARTMKALFRVPKSEVLNPQRKPHKNTPKPKHA